jgi:hypothetical protein
MAFDWDKRLNARAGLRDQNLALRNQQLQQDIAARQPDTRPPRIIGGKFLAPGEDSTDAIAARNNAVAEADARRGLRGSRTVRSMRGNPNSAMGGTALPSLSVSFDDVDNRGMMYGGDVTMKPKMVKQPGYKCGGKVKMPGYEKGGRLPRSDAFAWDDEDQYRMATGQVGKKSKDDGKDTIDVRVREGEYLLNPETVEGIGGGDYSNGVRILDETVRQMTGQEPGAVPVNEKGEAQRGFRKGGKMGYNVGGFVDDFGNLLDPREWNQAQRQYANTPQGRAALAGNMRGTQAAATAAVPPPAQVGPPRPTVRSFPTPAPAAGPAPEVFINDTTKRQNLARSASSRAGSRIGSLVGTADDWKNFKISVPEVNLRDSGRLTKGAGAFTGMLGTGLAAVGVGKGIYDIATAEDAGDVALGTADSLASGALMTPAAPVGAAYLAGRAGVDAGNAVYDQGIESGADWVDAVGGTINNIGVRTGLWGSPEYDFQIAEGNRLANEITGAGAPATPEAQAAAQQAAALDAARAASGEYYRPFGGGKVSLRDVPTAPASQAVAPGTMNIVQRTGGPAGEVIVREDIDGVPTFSNLRTAPQAGDAATLQAQADARAVQDMGIRQMQTAVVDQMRDAAPIYSQEGLDQRRAEQLARAEVAASGSGRGKAPASDAVMKSVKERFQRPSYDEDGNLTGSVDDVEAERTFMDAMSQLQHSSGVPMTVALESMSEGERAQVYEDFERVYRDTQMALRAAAQQGLPASDVLRTGAQGLRMEPTGREVRIGDVLGPEATWGDWWAGLGNDDPALNRYVQDPESGAVIPARRLTRNGLDLRALRDYGFVGE